MSRSSPVDVNASGNRASVNNNTIFSAEKSGNTEKKEIDINTENTINIKGGYNNKDQVFKDIGNTEVKTGGCSIL